MRRTAFVYSDDLLAYRLGPRHPLKQERLQMVHRLLAAYGLFSPDGPIDWILPTTAMEDDIQQVHTPEYVDAVRRASAGQRDGFLRQYGLSAGDTPAFDGMYEATLLYAGSTLDAARLVLFGWYDIAFSVAGGLHHAQPHRASGFCVFNDLALAVLELLSVFDRVAYIDLDAHHGDGVQAIFYDDPRVLTISLHESGRYLFPGTGNPDEIGEGDAAGTSLNVPLLPGSGDAVWLEAIDEVVGAALERFRPKAFVLQLGADAHWEDPLAHLNVSSRGWTAGVDRVLYHCEDKPTVVTGGGGYDVRTVARLWTLVQALCAGVDLPEGTPPAYDGLYGVSRLHDRQAPPFDPAREELCREFLHEQVRALQPVIRLL